MTHTNERIEEIVREICDLTGYGQALHPNDIKHYFTIYGAECEAKDRARIVEWAKEDVEYEAQPFNDEVVRVKGRFMYSGPDADDFYHGYCSCLADLITHLTTQSEDNH